jgi:hypothetical protein
MPWLRTGRARVDRTPDERRRENEEVLRQLSVLLKPDVYLRVVELVGVNHDWIPLLEAGLDRETFLDVIEAILTIQHDEKTSVG